MRTAGVMEVSKLTAVPIPLLGGVAKVSAQGTFGEALRAEVLSTGTPAKVVSAPSNSTVAYTERTVTNTRDEVVKPRDERHAAHEEEHGKASKGADAPVASAADKKNSSKEEVVASAAPVAVPETAVVLPAVNALGTSPVQPAIVVAGEEPAETITEEPALPRTSQVTKSVGRETKKVETTPVAAATGATAEVAVAAPVAPVQALEAGITTVKESGSLVGVAVVSAVPHPVGHVAKEVVAPAVVEAKGAEASAQNSDIRTLVATPNVLEVGIASGSHGWLRVRAEMGQTGEVTASVAAASAGAAEGLHKELPAISAYLAGERVGVSALVVNAMDKGSGAQDSAMSAGAGGQSGTGSETRRERQSGSGGAGGTDRAQSDDTGFDFGVAELNVPAAVYANGSGNWLSVRV